MPLSVTFGASETVKSFSLTATDDLANDDFESVVLGFGPLPSRVSAGSPPHWTKSGTFSLILTLAL